MTRFEAERLLSMWTWIGYQGAEIQARGSRDMPYYVVCFPAGSKTGDNVMTIPEALDLAEKKRAAADAAPSAGEEHRHSEQRKSRRGEVDPRRRGHAESGQHEADKRSHDED